MPRAAGRDAAEMRVEETTAPVSSVQGLGQQQASFDRAGEPFTARRCASPLFLKIIRRKLLNRTNYAARR